MAFVQTIAALACGGKGVKGNTARDDQEKIERDRARQQHDRQGVGFFHKGAEDRHKRGLPEADTARGGQGRCRDEVKGLQGEKVPERGPFTDRKSTEISRLVKQEMARKVDTERLADELHIVFKAIRPTYVLFRPFFKPFAPQLTPLNHPLVDQPFQGDFRPGGDHRGTKDQGGRDDDHPKGDNKAQEVKETIAVEGRPRKGGIVDHRKEPEDNL